MELGGGRAPGQQEVNIGMGCFLDSSGFSRESLILQAGPRVSGAALRVSKGHIRAWNQDHQFVRQWLRLLGIGRGAGLHTLTAHSPAILRMHVHRQTGGYVLQVAAHACLLYTCLRHNGRVTCMCALLSPHGTVL